MTKVLNCHFVWFWRGLFSAIQFERGERVQLFVPVCRVWSGRERRCQLEQVSVALLWLLYVGRVRCERGGLWLFVAHRVHPWAVCRCALHVRVVRVASVSCMQCCYFCPSSQLGSLRSCCAWLFRVSLLPYPPHTPTSPSSCCIRPVLLLALDLHTLLPSTPCAVVPPCFPPACTIGGADFERRPTSPPPTAIPLPPQSQ